MPKCFIFGDKKSFFQNKGQQKQQNSMKINKLTYHSQPILFLEKQKNCSREQNHQQNSEWIA